MNHEREKRESRTSIVDMVQIGGAIQEYLPFFCFSFFVGFKPFGLLRPLQSYGMQDRGVTVAVREMDVTPVNPYRFSQGQPPVHTAWF